MNANMDQAKGKVEQALGYLTGDDDLKRRGQADEAAGKVKEVLESVEDTAEGLVDTVKDAVHQD